MCLGGSDTVRRSTTDSTVLDSDEEEMQSLRKSTRLRSNRQLRNDSVSSHNSKAADIKANQIAECARRIQRRNQAPQRDSSYAEDVDADGEANPDMELDKDAVPTSPEPEPEPAPLPSRRSGNASKIQENRGYSLRARAKNVNYVIPPPLDRDETIENAMFKPTRFRSKPKKNMNWNMNGTELSRAMGLPLDDTVSSCLSWMSPVC